MTRKNTGIELHSNRAGLAVDDEDLRLAQAERIFQRTAGAIVDGTPANTARAYTTDYRKFEAWCLSQAPRLPSLPTNEIAIMGYLTELADERNEKGEFSVKAGTIERRLSGIIWRHSLDNHPSPRTPRIAKLIRAIKVTRANAREMQQQAAPLTVGDLRKMVRVLDQDRTPRAIRDKAMLILGWACAMRRSEIAALLRSDISEISREGFVVTIGRSKTDQTGEGEELPVSHEDVDSMCPVRAMEAWLQVRGDTPGPLFWRHWRGKRGGRMHEGRGLTEKQVALTFLEMVRRADLKPMSHHMEFSAHSLRAGFITEAIRAGRRESDVQKRSRHKTHSVFLGYVRIAQTFENNPQRGMFSKEE